MKNVFALWVMMLITLHAWSQNDKVVKLSNPTTVAKPNGYSHLAEIDMGKSKMLILSGQVALDVNGNLVGKDDFAKQAEQVFINIKSIIESAGGTMQDVVKLSYYVRDVSKIQTLREIRNRYIDVKKPPASTLVEVSNLFREDILLEIEATAVVVKK